MMVFYKNFTLYHLTFQKYTLYYKYSCDKVIFDGWKILENSDNNEYYAYFSLLKNNSPINESSNKCSRPEKTLSQKCMEKAKKRHEERLKIKLSKKVVSKLNTHKTTP